MADNVAITAGSGTTVSTDQIPGTGEHVQRVKILDGTADSTTPLKVDTNGSAAVALKDASGTALGTTSGALNVSLPTNVPIINKHISGSGTLTANSATTASLTVSGFTAVEIEVTNVDGAAAMYVTLDGTTPSATNFIAMLPATPSSVVLPMNTTPTCKIISAGTPKWAATVRGA